MTRMKHGHRAIRVHTVEVFPEDPDGESLPLEPGCKVLFAVEIRGEVLAHRDAHAARLALEASKTKEGSVNRHAG